MSHKMLFNTGVKPLKRRNKHGQFVLGKWETTEGGTIQIKYFLEHEPAKNLWFKYLAPTGYLDNMSPKEVAIKIVDGGMLSDYAIFGTIDQQ